MTLPIRREPIFNVPGVVIVLLAVLAGLHIVRGTLSDDDDTQFVLALAFIPDRYVSHPLPWPGGEWSAWLSPLTHMLLHGDWAHLFLNSAFLAAFGTIIARRVGAARFLGFTVASGLAGAMMFLAFNWGVRAPLIGASGAIAGMMAVALRLMFSAIDGVPAGYAGELLRRAPQLIPLKTLVQTLLDRRLQVATGVWLLINALAAYGLGTPSEAGVVAWEAHVGGYLFGLLFYDWFDRPEAIIHHEPDVSVTSADNSAP